MAIAKKITKTKTGSRGKYKRWLEPEGLLLIESWARDGLTDDQIAKNMGIHRDTLYTWKKKYADFSDTLKKGKEVVDIQVENALLKRALGYGYDEVKEEYEGGFLVKKTVTTKKVVPDTTAQIFWLKNRRSDKWRNNDRLEIATDDQVQPDMHKATLEALKSRKVKELFDEESDING